VLVLEIFDWLLLYLWPTVRLNSGLLFSPGRQSQQLTS